jgi:pyrophosphatase PpaX
MKKIRALLTDLDGTLIGSVDPICNALFECFRYVDAPVPEKQQIVDMFGLPVEVMLMELGGVKPEETERIDRFIAEYKRQYPIHMVKAKILPGVEETLAYFHDAGVKICLITNERRQNATHILDALGLSRFIKYMISRDDVTRFKPDPQPLHLAAEQVGQAGEDCAYIGEAPYDIQAGVASGIYTVAVPSGTWSPESLAACDPNRMIGAFSELMDLLKPADVEEV